MKEKDLNQIHNLARINGYPKAILYAIDKKDAIQKEIEEVRSKLSDLESDKENCFSMIDAVFDYMKESSPEEYAKRQVKGRGETMIKFSTGNTIWDIRQDRAYPDSIYCRIRIYKEEIDVIEINEQLQ